MITTIPLPRYEAWPVTECYPARVRHMWLDSKGQRCTCFVVSCEGPKGNDDAVICTVALASHYGAIADTSRVLFSASVSVPKPRRSR